MPFLWSVIYAALLGIASHLIGESLPREWFHADRFPFCACRWEREGKIYDRLHIRAWKDYLPDMSRVMPDMVPKRVGIGAHSDDVERLVQETCVAESVHVALCLLSPVIYLFWQNKIGVLLWILYAICNVPFIWIQRYNRPQLMRLAYRLRAREEKKQRACIDSVM